MNEATGIAHFVAQSDLVGKSLFVILLLMSMVSWYYIITKSITQYLTRQRSQAFMGFFWNATSLETVSAGLAAQGASDPFSRLTSQALFAREHHARVGAARLVEAGSVSDFLTRTMRKVIDEETTQLESGLTVLASVGADWLWRRGYNRLSGRVNERDHHGIVTACRRRRSRHRVKDDRQPSPMQQEHGSRHPAPQVSPRGLISRGGSSQSSHAGDVRHYMQK